MKKKVALLVASVLTMGTLFTTVTLAQDANTSNSSNTVEKTAETKSSNSSNSSNASKTQGAGVAKIGLGHASSIKKSKDFDPEKGATAQADVIFAAVGLDKDGKIVSVSIDNAQTKVEYNVDGTLKTNVKEEGKTKRDLGADYGMVKASGIKKEWFEQMDAFEAYLIGKTAEEVKNIEVKEKDKNHPAVPTGADLVSSVTISIEDYQKAVLSAIENAKEVKEEANKVGLGIVVSTAKSKEKTSEKGATAGIDVVATAVALKDDKVSEAVLDTVQAKIEYDLEGKVTSDKEAEIKSKVQLGDEYKMKEASKIKKEWHEQAKALTDWTIGKSKDEIVALKVEDKNGKKIPTEADLVSSVSIDVSKYVKVFEEAITKAK